jgi:hypothetical protein
MHFLDRLTDETFRYLRLGVPQPDFQDSAHLVMNFAHFARSRGCGSQRRRRGDQ